MRSQATRRPRIWRPQRSHQYQHAQLAQDVSYGPLPVFTPGEANRSRSIRAVAFQEQGSVAEGDLEALCDERGEWVANVRRTEQFDHVYVQLAGEIEVRRAF